MNPTIEYTPFCDRDSFAASVSDLFAVQAPVNERKDVVRRMTDDYFARFGEYPPPVQLSRLGTYLLRDTDGKKTMRAKGHMTRWQLEYREKREVPFDPSRYTKCTENVMHGKRIVVPASERNAR